MYKDSQGNLKGVAIDILNDFVEYAKTTYKAELQVRFIEESAFDKFLGRVSKTENVLGVSSVSITDERKKVLKFTPTFLTNPNVIITHTSAPKLNDLNDLSTIFGDFKVKVVKGSIHDSYAKDLKSKYNPALVIEYANSSRAIFREMTHDSKLFTIIDFGEYLGAFRSKLQLVRQNVDLGLIDNMGFIMHKSSDWNVVWDQFLTDEYRSSTRYRKIISDNLGSVYLALIK